MTRLTPLLIVPALGGLACLLAGNRRGMAALNVLAFLITLALGSASDCSPCSWPRRLFSCNETSSGCSPIRAWSTSASFAPALNSGNGQRESLREDHELYGLLNRLH